MRKDRNERQHSAVPLLNDATHSRPYFGSAIPTAPQSWDMIRTAIGARINGLCRGYERTCCAPIRAAPEAEPRLTYWLDSNEQETP